MHLLDYPRLIFVLAFALLWLAAWVGRALIRRRIDLSEEVRADFNVVLGATLTLLGLVIGFSFSMAIGRYDQRKTYEEAEANAIGTEYLRADVLPQAEAVRMRDLLREYTDLRIRFYETRKDEDLLRISADTARVQSELWRAASTPALTQQTPIVALAVAGMNDVINSQGYTQAAWLNRIPEAAWALLFAVATFSNFLLGYGAWRLEWKLLMVLPLVVAVSFFLIADIDSPRRGVIRVHPENMISLRGSLK